MPEGLFRQGVTAAGDRTVMLVGDDPMTLAGLASWVNKQPGLSVSYILDDERRAIEMLQDHKVDLLVVVIAHLYKSLPAVIKDLRSCSPETPILAVSTHDESIFAERVLKSGAQGYVRTGARLEDFVDAVETVLSGRVYVRHEPATAGV